MGLFDLPAPLLSWVDTFLGRVLPDIFMVIIWAAAAVGFGFLIFRRLSVHSREDERSGAGAQTWVPLIVALLPTVFIATWLNNSYEYAQPQPGSKVKMEIHSMVPEIVSGKKTQPRPRIDKFEKRWPKRDGSLMFRDMESAVGAALRASPVTPMVGKKAWWNAFFGNPVGYIPHDFAIERIEFKIEPREIIASKYYWLSNWKLWFALTLAVAVFGLMRLSRQK